MNTKAVFFDIDGTLWDKEHLIPMDTIRAISLLRANGHYAFINSGRCQGNIINPALLRMGWDGIVSGCGTFAQVGQKVLVDKIIPLQELEWIISFARSFKIRVILEGRFKIYFDDEEYYDDPYGRQLIWELGDNRATIRDNWGFWRAGKFSVDPDPDIPADAWVERISKGYNCMKHGEHFLECVPKGFSKAYGMELVCNHLGIPMEDSIAFGDSINDVEMLEAAGVGVVMGEHDIFAERAANMQTSGVKEGGIEKALTKLGLI